MNDLFELLDRAAGPEVLPDPGTLAADVVRGRRALARRRVLTGAGALTAAASVAVVVALVTAMPDGTASLGVPAGGPTTSTPPRPAEGGTGTGAPTPAATPVVETHTATDVAGRVTTVTQTLLRDVTPDPGTTTTLRGSEKDLQVPEPPPLVRTTDGAGLAFRPGLVPAGWTVDGTDQMTTLSPPGVTTGPQDPAGKWTVTFGHPDPSTLVKDLGAAGGRTYYGYMLGAVDDQVIGVRLPDGRWLQVEVRTPDLSVGSGYVVRLLSAMTVPPAG